MQYKNSTELMQQMAERTNGTCLLAFSTGKDALCAWVELRKHFHTIIPFYYYLVPGLSFIEQSLAYYEDFFETKIIRLPNTNLYRMLNNQVYQTPANNKIIHQFNFPTPKREDLLQYLKKDKGIDNDIFVSIGNRAADNMMRQRSIFKRDKVSGEIIQHRAHNEKNKTFFPVYDFSIAQVVQSVKSAPGLKLPIDYHLFGKTYRCGL